MIGTKLKLGLCIFLFPFLTLAQSQRGDLVRIMVSPTRGDMKYDVGEEISFDVAVYKYGQLLPGAEVSYSIGPEKLEPVEEGTITLDEGTISLKGAVLEQPGFVRCHVTYQEGGNTYHNSGTAAVDPENIQPTTTDPDDFDEFWQGQMDALREVDLDPVITLMPDKCTAETNAYHVSYRNLSGHIYGILTVPKKPGKYPAILQVPGAGVRPYHGSFYDQDVICLQVGIHGVPVNFYDSDLYDNLRNGPLDGYWKANLDNRDEYYYKRVYLGCTRAVDFIYGLPEFDGENLGVMGGSQGGALSIITAGMDDRIDYLVSYYPALCDLTGYLHDRAGGWPHLFRDEFTNTDAKVETSHYYDVVNFARRVNAEGFYSFGYNDNVCPPTSIYAAYNTIKAAKEISLFPDSAHWTYPEQREEGNDWILEKLGVH